MNQPILRVLLVDDHFIVRAGIKALLEKAHDITVVGEASDGAEAIVAARELAPDVILMDLQMPGINGGEAIRKILASAPQTRILILTGSATEKGTLQAVRAGALGYLSKDCNQGACLEAIRKIHRGEVSLPADITRRLMHDFEKPGPSTKTLTRRELDVLRRLAQGRDDDEIAEQLHVSKATIRSHVSNMLAKLQLKNRVEATLYALRHDLVALEDDA